MKSRNKLFALVMSIVMIFSLCATACGGETPGGTTPGGETPGGDTPVTPPKDDPKVHSVVLKMDGNVVGDTLEANLSEGTLTLVAEVVKDDGADGKVTWTSSETQVATVSEGVVTMKKEGDTTIRAEAGNVSAQVKLTVKTTAVNPPPKDPEVHSVTIKQGGDVAEDVLTVYLEDGSVKLDAVVTKDEDADGTVAWTSSNGDVATVSSQGNVTLKTVGETTIKAQAGDKYDELLLKVANKPVEPEPEPEVHSVAIRYNDANVNDTLSTGLTAETISLKVAVTCDEGADYTVSWSSSVETVATVEGDNTGATVTLLDAGETVIKAVAGEKMAQFVLKVSDDRPPVSYTITVTDGVAKNAEGEEITSAVAGEQVTLEATIPAHKTFTDWTVEGGGVELNGNMFTMPEGNVTATANFVDTLYPLTVVGGTVVKAGETSNPEGTPGEGSGETKEMTYRFAYDTEITIAANAAAGGNVFVAWDYMVTNNRIGELGLEEYKFNMGDGDNARYTAVYTELQTSIFSDAHVATEAYWDNTQSKIITNGTPEGEGADPDLRGLSGCRLAFKGDAKAETGLVGHNIPTSAYHFTTKTVSHNGGSAAVKARGMGIIILKNHSNKPVTLEIAGNSPGIFTGSGYVTVEANSTTRKCFIFSDDVGGGSWWGVALRADIGGTADERVVVDMVCGMGTELYPSGDPFYKLQDGAQQVHFVGGGTFGTSYSNGDGNVGFLLKDQDGAGPNGGYINMRGWAGEYGPDAANRWAAVVINNLPAYSEGMETTAIYGRAINTANNTFAHSQSKWKVVITTNETAPTDGIVWEIDFKESGQTELFKFELPRTAEPQTYRVYIVLEDLCGLTGQVGVSLFLNLTYNNVFGYQEA